MHTGEIILEGKMKSMRSTIITIATGVVCLGVGLFFGAWQSSKLKTTEVGKAITTASSSLPWSKDDGESPFESNEYPTLKWRARVLTDAPGAIVRLWTMYEPGLKNDPQGTMKYKLTLFKATNKDAREVQLLDSMGFKLLQFNASDFHNIPEAPDIVEARDGIPCTEEQYKKARAFSVK